MKRLSRILVTALMLGLSASCVIAQLPEGPPPDGDRSPPPAGGGQTGTPRMRGRRPPPSPLIAALDANGDGIIDANEIANAAAALASLDKNGDGKLTPDEYMPPRPAGNRGPGGPPSEGQMAGRGEDGDRLQPTDGQYPPPRGGGPLGDGGGETNRPPRPPIIAALDLNGDGIIDANEIAMAAESLKKLDKNGDGVLTPDEFLPRRRSGQIGPAGNGGRGPRGGPGGRGSRPPDGPGGPDAPGERPPDHGDGPQRPPPPDN